MSKIVKIRSGSILFPNHFEALKKELTKTKIFSYDYGVIDYSINLEDLNKGFLKLDFIEFINLNGEYVNTNLSSSFQLNSDKSDNIIYIFIEKYKTEIVEELTDNGNLVAMEYEIPIIGFSTEDIGNIPLCKISFINGRFQLMNFLPPLLVIHKNLKVKINEFYDFLLKLHNVFLCEYNEFLLYLISKAIIAIETIYKPYDLFISLLDLFAYSTKDKLIKIVYNHNDIYKTFNSMFQIITSFFEYKSISNKIESFSKKGDFFSIKLGKVFNYVKIIIDSSLNISDIQKWVNESKIATISKWYEISKRIITGANKEYIQTIGGRYVFHLQVGEFIKSDEELRISHPNMDAVKYIFLAEKLSI